MIKYKSQVIGVNVLMLIKEIIKAMSMLQVIMLFSNPIEYREEQILLNNHQQKVYTLEVDMNSDNIELSNALSFDMFYGFETTSEINERSDAIAGVNGMFYDDLGYPSGIIVKGGLIISTNDIGMPTVMIGDDGSVVIDDVDIFVEIEVKENTYRLSGVNKAVKSEEYVLFDLNYGPTTRVRRNSMNYQINDGEITNIIYTNQPVSLRQNDFVLTRVTENDQPLFKVGDKINIIYNYSNDLTNVKEAFQSGGWLVRAGKEAVDAELSYGGNIYAPNPRTLIGVDANNKMIIKVIDGRNQVSYGVTLKEAAELMIENGCIYAVNMDGGASSTMIVNKQLVNTPSNGSVERIVAHAIVIKRPPVYRYKRVDYTK